MENKILYIAVIILAIFQIVQLIRHAELKGRLEYLQKESRKYLDIFEHSTRVVEATERMSDAYTEQSKWMMEHTSDALVKINRTIQELSREIDELDTTYESLSKRNELLDKELKKSCECCRETQARLDMILTPPQIKPIPVPDWSNVPSTAKPDIWGLFPNRNDSISDSTVFPEVMLKGVDAVKHVTTAVNSLKDLAETAVDAVKESIDSVPDPYEFEPEEWHEEGVWKVCEETGEGPEEGTDGENL